MICPARPEHRPEEASLLEFSGICVVPASGFGQREGRYGFRTTFLPCEEEITKAVGLFKKHHESFCEQYA